MDHISFWSILTTFWTANWSLEREVTGSWRRLYNEELKNLYPSPNIIMVIKSKRVRQIGNVVRIEGMRNAYKIVIGTLEGKIPLGKPRHRWWEDNITTDLGRTGLEGVECIHVAQNVDKLQDLMNTAMKLRVP
jgi:hypothetical protein